MSSSSQPGAQGSSSGAGTQGCCVVAGGLSSFTAGRVGVGSCFMRLIILKRRCKITPSPPRPPHQKSARSAPPKIERVAEGQGSPHGIAASSPPKLGGVARGAEGVCSPGDAAPTLASHTPPSLRATSPSLGEELPCSWDIGSCCAQKSCAIRCRWRSLCDGLRGKCVRGRNSCGRCSKSCRRAPRGSRTPCR